MKTIILLMILFLPNSQNKAVDKNNGHWIYDVLKRADVPSQEWNEYIAVAGCESRMNPLAEGDGGNAKGLFQIHWNTWAEWANSNGYGPFTDWTDPIQNTMLAQAINDGYDLPKHGRKWEQWTVNPYWSSCQEWIP